MVLYKCECGYETNIKGHMKNHLNRIISCTLNKDMKLIDVNTLLIKGKIYQKLSHLTLEEKSEKDKQRHSKNDSNNNILGKLTTEMFAKQVLKYMKNSSKKRNHNLPSWILEDVVKILQNNQIYIIKDTVLGQLEFPMMLTNGYHNTASFDRINNNLGYYESNIEIRPFFLNTLYKLDTEDIKNIIKIREEKQNNQELVNIAKNITSKWTCFFYTLSKSAKHHSDENRGKTFDFINIKECALFLIKLYIEQGGRCAYSKIPIYPETGHKYRISTERLDPTKSYSKDNIVLIVVGLNGRLPGQYLNKNLTDEQTQEALEAARFNQEYWDICTKMTPEIVQKCEEVREYGKHILLENLSNEMIKLINV